MRQPENILARWSRRKLETIKGVGQSSARPSPWSGTGEEGRTGTDAVPATQSDGNTPIQETLDPANLPPIESITASTDIRSFMRAGGPLELTRDALRQAWVTDPAIRDFIGIAESQWDFNDPTAMLGFGPLQSADVAGLAGQLRGSADQAMGCLTEGCGAGPSQEAFAEEPKGDGRAA
jgi:Protein of unknown function (DUF3306)